jgi:hypothetical protein
MRKHARVWVVTILLFAGGLVVPQSTPLAQEIVLIRQFGTAAEDTARRVAVDGTRSVYMAGHTAGAMPGQSSAGGNDAFVRKYDAGLNAVWTRQFGTAGSDIAIGIAVEGEAIYVVGRMSDASGLEDAFVRKYDATGNLLATRQFGDPFQSETATGVAVDGTGSVYVAGDTFGTLPGQTSAGFVDAFVREYDAGGSEMWTNQFGTSSQDYAQGVAADVTGNVYAVGRTEGTLPGQTSAGDFDAFVVKLSEITVIPVAIDINPASSSNTINPRSGAQIPAAILTTTSFDAATVDPATVRFGRTGTEAPPSQFTLVDVDADGDSDLVLLFHIRETGIACGDTSASLTGEAFGGEAIEGSDSIQTIGYR